jgi:nitrous oxide reductase accessory protein NosL
VKKTAVVLVALVALAAAGCKKKEEAAPQAPPTGMPAQQVPAAAPAGDPHSGMKPQAIPAGTPTHKGKVLTTMDAAGYTYMEVEENGQKLWVAIMQTPIKVGDVVEFPDSPPMANFQSKTLKRTFEKIIFAPAVRIVK